MPEYPPSLNPDTLDEFLDEQPHSLIHLDAKWDAWGFQLQKRIQKILPNYSDTVGFGFIDVDAHQEHALAVEVKNVPACAYYRGRERMTTIIGLNQDIETNLEILRRGDVPDGSARIELD
ncbi:MAG: thioredoxin domain-containing protein [Verrucomicrobiota bacterium]